MQEDKFNALSGASPMYCTTTDCTVTLVIYALFLSSIQTVHIVCNIPD